MKFTKFLITVVLASLATSSLALADGYPHEQFLPIDGQAVTQLENKNHGAAFDSLSQAEKDKFSSLLSAFQRATEVAVFTGYAYEYTKREAAENRGSELLESKREVLLKDFNEKYSVAATLDGEIVAKRNEYVKNHVFEYGLMKTSYEVDVIDRLTKVLGVMHDSFSRAKSYDEQVINHPRRLHEIIEYVSYVSGVAPNREHEHEHNESRK